MSGIREAAVLVAHVLYTPMTALEEVTVMELLEWADEADGLVRQIYGKRLRSGR